MAPTAVRSFLARRWPPIRAAAVGLHLLAVLVLALPNFGGDVLRRKAWKQPVVQAEFDAWADRMRTTGLEVTPEQLEQWLWGAAHRWRAIHSAITAPIEPYSRYTGVRQRWRMFAAPVPITHRLEIAVREGGQWRPIYVHGSPEYTWNRSRIAHDRMRSLLARFTWPQYRSKRTQFFEWVVRRVAEDFPEASEVRMVFVRHRAPTPEQARQGHQPPETIEARHVRSLESHRREGAGR